MVTVASFTENNHWTRGFQPFWSLNVNWFGCWYGSTVLTQHPCWTTFWTLITLRQRKRTLKFQFYVVYYTYVHVHWDNIVWQTIALPCHGLLVDRFISDPFTVTPPGSPGSPGSASRHKMIRVIACYLPKYHSTWVIPRHNHKHTQI